MRGGVRLPRAFVPRRTLQANDPHNDPRGISATSRHPPLRASLATSGPRTSRHRSAHLASTHWSLASVPHARRPAPPTKLVAVAPRHLVATRYRGHRNVSSAHLFASKLFIHWDFMAGIVRAGLGMPVALQPGELVAAFKDQAREADDVDC